MSEPIGQTHLVREMADTQWWISVPGPGGAIQDRKDWLIVPMWRFAPWRAFAIFSEDHGRTWHRGAQAPEAQVPGTEGVDKDQLGEVSDGRILLDARQHGGPHRWTATSSDGGRTWSAPRPGQPMTPVCCAIERYTLKSAGDDRDRILWTVPEGPGRNKLIVRTSYNEGRTFTNQRTISDEPAAYSDLTILKDKSVGVLWERGNYRFIAFTRFDRKFLEPEL
jgi:sialidase-1